MAENSEPRRGPARRGRPPRRRLSRLAAVQALYQIDMNGEPVERVIRQFREHRLGQEIDGLTLAADPDFFASIVRGTAGAQAQLDARITAAAPAHAPERLEAVLRAILRAGIHEIEMRPDTPARVAVSEYVDIAADFFSDREAGLVNAVLDRIARELRPADYEAPGAGPAG